MSRRAATVTVIALTVALMGSVVMPAPMAAGQAMTLQQQSASASTLGAGADMTATRADALALHATVAQTRLAVMAVMRHTGASNTTTRSAGMIGGMYCAGQSVYWPATIRQWTVPSGCFSHIYYPSPARYVPRPSYGWCNWWPEVLHPRLSGYTALHLPSHSVPVVGAVVFFAPYVQGASGDGHYAEVVAIGPHGWLLITEMNFYWRGGGFARVDFRFIHTGAGVSFRYD